MMRGVAVPLLVIVAASVLFATGVSATKDQWQFRLTAEGYVEMRPDRTKAWGNICAKGMDENEATAVCRSLGRPPKGPGDFIFAFAVPPVDTSTPMYLAGLSCSSSEMLATECLSTLYPNGITDTNICDPANEATALSCPDPPDEPPAPPHIFTFTFIPTVSYTKQGFTTVFKNNIIQHFDDDPQVPSITADRISVDNLVEDQYQGNNRFTITFHFTDVPPGSVQPPKEEFEYYMEDDAALIFGTNLGLQTTSKVTPTPAPGTPKPSTDGWEYRITGGDMRFIGRMEVKPGPDAQWGGVCQAGFQEAEAIAACYSAGYYTTSIKVLHSYGTPPGMPMWLSDVKCIAATNQKIQDCEWRLSTDDDTIVACANSDAVGINCYFNTTDIPPLPDNTTYSPKHFTQVIAWSITVQKIHYDSADEALAVLAGYGDIPRDRIQVLTNSSDDNFYYMTFVITNAGPSDPPRVDYDTELDSVNSFDLEFILYIDELTKNTTGSVITYAPGVPHSEGWVVALGDTSKPQPQTRGIFTVRPRKSGADGTVCSKQLDRVAAGALCRSAGITDFDFVAVLPYMPGGSGNIYLSDILCGPSDVHIDNCTYTASYPEDKRNDCSHVTDAGAICEKFVGPESSSTVTIFNAVYPANQFDQSFFNYLLSANMELDAYRAVTISEVEQSNGENVDVKFYFRNNDAASGIPREAYEYFFKNLNQEGLDSFNMNRLTWTTGPIPAAPTSAPGQLHDMSGWHFRIRQGGNSGLFEVKPTNEDTYGTVCADNWDTKMAEIACRTLRFADPTDAFPFRDADIADGGLVMFMSGTTCDASASVLGDCKFTLSSSNVDRSTCSPGNILSINCGSRGTLPPTPVPPTPTPQPFVPQTPAPPTPAPIPLPTLSPNPVTFTVIVRTDSYEAEMFQSLWAVYYWIVEERIVISSTSTYGVYTYVNFKYGAAEMLERKSHLLSRVFAAQASGGADKPKHDFTGMDMAGAPEGALDYVTEYMPALIQYEYFGVYEMRHSLMTPNGAVTSNRNQWNWRLVDSPLANTDYSFGRIELQPGSDAPWGTVCGTGALYEAPLALCNAIRPSNLPQVTTALLVPHYAEGQGIIFLGDLSCPSASLGACTYTFSTKTQKKNDCTHLEDSGLLCGVGVGIEEADPLVFRAIFTRSEFSMSRFDSSIQSIFGVSPTQRVLKLDQSNDDTNVYLNFSFTSPPTGGNADLTRGDMELVMRSISPYGLQYMFSMKKLEYTSMAVGPVTPIPPVENCTVAQDCNGNAQSVFGDRLSGCICSNCVNQWRGTACGVCDAKYDKANGCKSCAAGYTGYPACNPTGTVAPPTPTPPRQCTVALDCNNNGLSVTGSFPQCTCQCRNQWTDTSCGTCPSNFDPLQACGKCAAGYDSYPSCSPSKCTIADDCGGRAVSVTGERTTGCTCSCRNRWAGSKCTTCPPNYNPLQDCGACAEGYSGSYPNCAPMTSSQATPQPAATPVPTATDAPTPCTVAADCNNHAMSVAGTREQGCSCTCKNQWANADCSLCPTKYDASKDCAACSPSFQNYPACEPIPATPAPPTPVPPTPCTIQSDCSNHATSVTGDSSTGCACNCRNSWTGETCDVCPSTYDMTKDCGSCRVGFTGYPSCAPAVCTIAADCGGKANSVTGNKVIGCSCSCKDKWTGDDCSTCPVNYDGNNGCKSCADGYQSYPDCTPITPVPPTPQPPATPQPPTPIPCTVADDCNGRASSAAGDRNVGGCVCSCRAQWTGLACDVCPTKFNSSEDCGKCAEGYMNYPQCDPIPLTPAPAPCSVLADCNNNAISVSGMPSDGCTCVCKNQWTGSKCETCPSKYSAAAQCGSCANGRFNYPSCELPGTQSPTTTPQPPAETPRPATNSPSTPAPATPPVPTVEPSINGVVIITQGATSFDALRMSLIALLCSENPCAGAHVTRPRDVYLMYSLPQAATRFVVSFNTSGLMYEVVGLPVEAMDAIGVLSASYAQAPPQSMADRGFRKTIVHITTNYQCNQCSDVVNRYEGFNSVRSGLGSFLLKSTMNLEAEMVLINSTGRRLQNQNFAMSFYVSVWQTNLAIELTSLVWPTLVVQGAYSESVTNVEWVSPGQGADLSALQHRVQYTFNYRPFDASAGRARYLPYTTFAQNLATAYNSQTGSSLSASAISLVDAAATPFNNGTTLEVFTVSFPNDNVRTEMTASRTTEKLDRNGVEISGAAAVGDDAAAGDDSGFKITLPMMIGAGVAGLVIIGVVAAVIRRSIRKRKYKGESYFDYEDRKAKEMAFAHELAAV